MYEKDNQPMISSKLIRQYQYICQVQFDCMNSRNVIIVMVGFVITVMVFASSAYLYSNSILETLGEIVVYLMGMSILCGVLLYFYVKITARSVFDPLDIIEEIPED